MISRAHGRSRLAGPLLALAAVLATGTALLIAAPPDALAGQSVKSGKYAGHLLDDGEVSKKEWLRFKVSKNRKRVTGYTSRLWVVCYSYPNNYSRLPVKFKAPNARIKSGEVTRRWKQNYRVDGERYTLTGLLKLNFRKRGKFRGKISVDFANCATKTGDFPHFVPLKGKRKK